MSQTSYSAREIPNDLITIERTLWENDAEIYHDRYSPEALVIFPGVGRRWALVGAVLFLLGAFFFELVVGIGGFGLGLGGYGWPLGLVIAGILMLAGGLLYRRK